MVCSPIKAVRELGSERQKWRCLRVTLGKTKLAHIGEALLNYELVERVIPREGGKL